MDVRWNEEIDMLIVALFIYSSIYLSVPDFSVCVSLCKYFPFTLRST